MRSPRIDTHRKVLWDVLLYEADISSVSGASSLLVHLVLIAVKFFSGDRSLLSLELSSIGLIV